LQIILNGGGYMPGEKIEEETYSLIFRSLKHPIRRKILRILVDKELGFSQILDILSIDSGHLSYHIENLGDLVRHSVNGKYELSSIGVAAVNLMSGVEDVPQLLALTGKVRGKKIRSVLMGAVLVILIISATFNIYYFNSLQASLKKNRDASSYLARDLHISVFRATNIAYLLRMYRGGLGETEPNEDNIEALIGGVFNEMEYAWSFLYGLRDLHPELSEYEKPLYVFDEFIFRTFITFESHGGGPTVRSVLDNLLAEAHTFGNYSIPLTAFKELAQTSFQKINEWSSEVVESFFPLNRTRLDNTVNMVEELQGILDQWIEKYS
jgi:DNA-binding transcriptional ArsR family regulator